MRLREKKIPFQGVEIDLLADLAHLRDVWSLTQALLMPANRLAWLEFLRSPWCGISLSDLHCLANIDPKQSIYLALSKLNTVAELSDEGKTRCQFIMDVLQHNGCGNSQRNKNKRRDNSPRHFNAYMLMK